MIPAGLFIPHLRELAIRHSPFERALLDQLLTDLYDQSCYVIGATGLTVPDLFADPKRHIGCFYHVALEPIQHQPQSLGISDAFPGPLVREEWEAMTEVVRDFYLATIIDQRLDPDGVILPVPARATMLLSVTNDEPEALCLIHRCLTDIQGLALLYRSVNNWWDCHHPGAEFGHEAIH